MSKFGFGEADQLVNLGDLPQSTVRERRTGLDKSIIDGAEKLGFKDRSGVKATQNRKPGRKKATVERSQVLITGPADIIEEFKRFCIENGDVPYWEGLRDLLLK